jgi:hypothetical protein
MDAPSREKGKGHRVKRHDPLYTPLEACEVYGHFNVNRFKDLDFLANEIVTKKILRSDKAYEHLWPYMKKGLSDLSFRPTVEEFLFWKLFLERIPEVSETIEDAKINLPKNLLIARIVLQHLRLDGLITPKEEKMLAKMWNDKFSWILAAHIQSHYDEFAWIPDAMANALKVIEEKHQKADWERQKKQERIEQEGQKMEKMRWRENAVRQLKEKTVVISYLVAIPLTLLLFLAGLFALMSFASLFSGGFGLIIVFLGSFPIGVAAVFMVSPIAKHIEKTLFARELKKLQESNA